MVRADKLARGPRSCHTGRMGLSGKVPPPEEGSSSGEVKNPSVNKGVRTDASITTSR
jgi:hypothetical protein